MSGTTPYTVTVPDGRVNLVVMNATDGLPSAFALMGTRVEHKVALRLAGGCKGMEESEKQDMLSFFHSAFEGFRGLIWSGGTRAVKDGKVDIIITEVPGVIAANNPGCIALGTVPRTDMLRLRGESRLELNDYDQILNPNLSGILLVQNGPDKNLDWDGDLDAYFHLMENWQHYAGFSQVGLVAWNGGEVTRQEIFRAAQKRWPLFLIRGSGRVTDEIIHGIECGQASVLDALGKTPMIFIVEHDRPHELHKALGDTGFIR